MVGDGHEEINEDGGVGDGHEEVDGVDNDGFGYEDGDNDDDDDAEAHDDVVGDGDGSSGGDESCFENGITINCMADIVNIDMKNISTADVDRFHFPDLKVAHQFYIWYGRISGFSVRKSRVVKDRLGEIVQQTFVCSQEGFMVDRGITQEMRKREQRNLTRCSCEAKFCTHVDIRSRHWYITLWLDDHNHDLLDDIFRAMLPVHRKMSDADVFQIENSTKVGIRPPHIYGAFANNAGGYHKIGFQKKRHLQSNSQTTKKAVFRCHWCC